MARYEAEANPDVPYSYTCPHCYPLPPFERPGVWRAEVTIYRDNVAIATADTYLTDPGQTFDLGYATHQIGNVIECEPTLTARGEREQAAFERGQG